ncbi:MAG: serine/threonine protein kinase [Myxococcaceae bacterium]|nr:serine/threonine protein kinase [Myxococcaceae bacterium]MBH2006105.1 serine/threonine protein kinase [Myxococcaceae bacterium]
MKFTFIFLLVLPTDLAISARTFGIISRTRYQILSCSGAGNNCFFHALRQAGIDIQRQDVIHFLTRNREHPTIQTAVHRVAAQELLTFSGELEAPIQEFRAYLEQHPSEAMANLGSNEDLYSWFVEHLQNGNPMPFERDWQELPGPDFFELLGQAFDFDVQILSRSQQIPSHYEVIRQFQTPTSTRRRHVELLFQAGDIGHFELLVDPNAGSPIPATVQDYFHNIITPYTSGALYTNASLRASGNFGQIFYVKNRDRSYAAKWVIGQNSDSFRAEQEALRRLHSPFCNGLIELFESLYDGNYLLLLEWVGGGSLREAIKTQEFEDYQVVAIATQLLLALKHIHDQGVIHCDIKPQNILLNPGGNYAQICDFGLAEIDSKLHKQGVLKGSPNYMAPEVIQNGMITPQADIWGLGVTLYRLSFKRHPYPSNTFMETRENVWQPIAFPRSQRLTPVLERMFETDYQRRPSAEDLLNERLIQVFLTMLAHVDPRVPSEHRASYRDQIRLIDWSQPISQSHQNPPFVIAVNYLNGSFTLLVSWKNWTAITE